MVGQIKKRAGQRQIKMSYICRSCGEVVKSEWRQFGPEFEFGDMCSECREAEAKYAVKNN
jgi:transcription initiation factor TFIIIB Brf1 subunit/transcription initiation factor TFIIB